MITHGNEIKLFSGNSNRPLAEAIAKKLNTELSGIEVTTFSDGEISVHIEETVRGRDLFIIQSTCSPVNDHLMELLIMIDAAKRASAGRITAVIPYLGYARQDRKARSRDPITAKLVANLILFCIFGIYGHNVDIAVFCFIEPGKVVNAYYVYVNLGAVGGSYTAKLLKCIAHKLLRAENLVAAAEGFDFGERIVKCLYAKCHGISIAYDPGIRAIFFYIPCNLFIHWNGTHCTHYTTGT